MSKIVGGAAASLRRAAHETPQTFPGIDTLIKLVGDAVASAPFVLLAWLGVAAVAAGRKRLGRPLRFRTWPWALAAWGLMTLIVARLGEPTASAWGSGVSLGVLVVGIVYWLTCLVRPRGESASN